MPDWWGPLIDPRNPYPPQPVSRLNIVAGKQFHLALNRIEARIREHSIQPRKVRAGEFSMSAYLGRTSSMIRCISTHNPLLFHRSILLCLVLCHVVLMSLATEIRQKQHQQFLSIVVPSNVRTSSQIGNAGETLSFCRCTRTQL